MQLNDDENINKMEKIKERIEVFSQAVL